MPGHKDGEPIPMTADALHDLIKTGAKAAPTPPMSVDPPKEAPPASTPYTPPPAVLPPPLPIPVFGPPAKVISTEDILGHPLLPPAPVIPPPLPQAQSEGDPETGPRKQISDPLDRDRRRERSSSETKRKSEQTVGRLLADYPSTKMVNVRLQWRDPVTRSYRKKGRIKNVSLNDIRDPESWCEGPGGVMFGGDWVMGYMPADQGKHFDDPKAWYEFDFDRDGPEPPREWTIDQPIQEHLYLEVDGMGQINLPDLTKLIENTVKQALTPPVPTTPPGMLPGYIPGQPPMHPGYQPIPPPRDTKAEERERKLEEALAKSREQVDAIMQRLNEKEREAQDARFKAEREAADARHQAELHGVLAKLTAMEARINQPPPAPAPSTDFAAMSTLKEILVGNRSAETEERRREAEERLRRLDEERQQRDREREEARDRRERDREEERSRRDEERARREASDREAQRTLEQYRMMGEASLASARAVAEISGKQNDPAPTLAVLSAMSTQTVQQAQVMATLFKNFGQGGSSGTNWPELIAQLAPDAFRAVSDLGTSIAQAVEAKAKIAAQMQQPRVLPPPTQPAMAGMQPTPAPVVAPMPPPPRHPLSLYIDRVNQAVGSMEDPEKVAGKLAAVVHAAQEFGTVGASKQIQIAIRALQEDPLPFLKRAYPSSDPAYLERIAKTLMEQFGPEEDGEEDEDNTESEAAEPQESQPTPQTAREAPQEPPQAPQPPPAEAQAVPTVQEPPQAPVKPAVVRIVATGPDGVTRDVTPSAPPAPVAASEPSDAGNGGKKRRTRGGTRRTPHQIPIPEVAGLPPEPQTASTTVPTPSTDVVIPSTTVGMPSTTVDGGQ
jgi:hypothetical protein